MHAHDAYGPCCGNPHPYGIDPCLCGSPETQKAFARVSADLDRRQMLGGAAAVLGLFAGFGLSEKPAWAAGPGQAVRLTNLSFFDGETLSIQRGRDIVVKDGLIAAMPGRDDPYADAVLRDCGGRVVIPGLIDCHWHSTLVAVSMIAALTQDIGFVHLMAGREAGATLRRGFTTVRDVGGPAFGLKLAIDRGALPGPRIFPSGAALSQTAGHGDFRLTHEVPRTDATPLSRVEAEGVNVIADGVDEVLRRTREQLMKGASQIKIMAGGGVSSLYDPLDVTQYTEPEIVAAVEAAADWGTYVCAHVYTPKGIQRCISAGVKSIEHGQLADEETVRMMAGEGVWWSIQPFLKDEDANQYTDPSQIAKQEEVSEGTLRAFDLARRLNVKWAFGTDILFSASGGASQGRQLAKLTRFMSPLEALFRATGAAGQLLAMSGARAPYPMPLGVLRPGAAADLLVVNGDPSESLDFLGNPESSMPLIMKAGAVIKDELG